MNSLRAIKDSAVAFVVAMSFVACSDGPLGPFAGRGGTASAPGAAQLDGKVGSAGNSANGASINARVLLDNNGNASLEVRTGTFDARTNTGTADGVFQSIQYKVLNGVGKQVVVRNVSFARSSTSTYVTVMNLCSSGDDDADAGNQSPSCGTRFGADWSVSIQANLEGVGGDATRTDVVRTDASVSHVQDSDPSATADISAQPLQRAGNGVNATTIIALDTAKVNETVTIRAAFMNTSTRATAIDCTINGNAALNAQPVGAVTNVSVPAGGTAVCQYSLKPVALGSYPVSVAATPTTSSPSDPNPANNAASGTLAVRASGSFDVASGTFNIFQDWTNPANAPAWPIATTLDHQVFQTSQLSLLVLPTQSVLGTFSLSGTVTSGSSNFGTGSVASQTLRAANPGEQVCITVGPAASLGNAAEPALVYFAQVCSQQSSVPGLQAITVNYTQSVNGAVPAGSNPLAFTGGVTMNLALDFVLTGSSSADRATVTVHAPIVNQATNCTASFDLTAQSCSTQFGTPVVTTP
jgi:hypothetical protein